MITSQRQGINTKTETCDRVTKKRHETLNRDVTQRQAIHGTEKREQDIDMARRPKQRHETWT